MLPPQALKPVINWELAQFTTPWRLQEAFAPFKLQQQQLCNVRSPTGDRPYITSNTYLKRGRNRMCMWSNLWPLSSNQAVQAEPPSKATQDRHLGLLADPCSTELHTNICLRKICHCNNVLAAWLARFLSHMAWRAPQLLSVLKPKLSKRGNIFLLVRLGPSF